MLRLRWTVMKTALMAVWPTVSPRRSRRRPAPPGAPAAARGKSPPPARLTRPAPARVGRCPGEPTGHRSGLPIAVRVLMAGAAPRPAAAICVSTRVPRVGGCCRATQVSTTSVLRHRVGGERPFRSARPCEPRDRDRTKIGPSALLSGVGDEYAISARPTPALNSRLTGDRRTLTDAVIVRPWPTGRV